MLMQGRPCLHACRYIVCRFREMVVPMRMRRPTPMPMNMDVAREHGRLASERCVERVVGRVRSVIMRIAMVVIVSVSVIMRGEPRLKDVRPAPVFQRDDDVEFVRLGNLLDGFPVSPMICKKKNLALPPGAQRLDPEAMSVDASQTKARRNTRLINRQDQLTVVRGNLLHFWPVDLAGAKACETMSMTVAMPALSAEFAPRRNRDPCAEGHQRDARRGIDEVPKVRGNGNPGKPNAQCNQQRRKHVPESSPERGARRLALRPAALARNKRNRHPVVRNHRVQNADGGNGTDQQQLGTDIHRSSP